jgi:selenocysteine-specific elongation factor
MLAGVGGIDLALLVVAADEGIMPQTEEHLAILEILQIKRAVVVLTKKDLVEDDWLELVESDVTDRLSRSPIPDMPVVSVSALTGEGLPELLATIDRALDDTPPKPNRGRPRVAIDRIFTMSGFGTVVTGTLIDGTLEVGEELEVQPTGLKTRARGIQTHKQKVERATPGSRVAVNLAGVPVETIERGQVLTAPGWLRPTTSIDARIQTLMGRGSLTHNASVSLHTGSTEASARVRLLDADALEPASSGFAQIQLASPIAVAKGDLFVLRTSNDTIGGGVVVEAHPKRHRRHAVEVLSKLAALERGEPADMVLQAMDGRFGSDLATIVERSGLSPDEARVVVQDLTARGQAIHLGDRFLTADGLASLKATVVTALQNYHERYPLRAGISREELKSRLRLSARESTALFDYLASQEAVVLEESVARLPSHHPTLTSQQEEKVRHLVSELSQHPFAPPDLDALRTKYEIDDELLAAVISRGAIARLTDSIAFSGAALAEIRRQVVDRIQRNGSISVAEVRDMLDTSRKYALALMEYFDQQRVTRRVGDNRVLR